MGLLGGVAETGNNSRMVSKFSWRLVVKIPKEIADRLLLGWHRAFGHRRAEFSDEQKAVRLQLQRSGLLGFDLTSIAESIRKIWR
mgnify:CR=1 FL=1